MLYTALTCEKFSKRVMKLIMAMMLVLIMLLMVATMVLVVMVMTVMMLVVLVVLVRKKLKGKDIRSHLLPQSLTFSPTFLSFPLLIPLSSYSLSYLFSFPPPPASPPLFFFSLPPTFLSSQ